MGDGEEDRLGRERYRGMIKSRDLPPIRRITQQTGTSCGIACVAMLARISYREAFRAGIECYDKEHWSGTHRTTIGELRDILASLGWRLGRKVATTDWKKVPEGCLVAVHWKEEQGWHWVVTSEDDDGAFFFDPRKSVKAYGRRDFKKVPVAWYHHVRLSK
jgi:ABC-type bacteriocin/lantibiotic exporter with double-glycine peptidase domain